VIIFAGVFASWTVATRSQEFYALLLALVTGVYGVFVSLDLFVFFLFYELAVLPMYLLIGIWGSSGEVRPAGSSAGRFARPAWVQRVRGDEAHALLLFGSAFILVGIFALYYGTGSGSFSFLELEAASVTPRTQFWVFLAFYIGFGILAGIWPLHTWSPDGHASAPDRGLDAARRGAHEARRLRRRAAGMGLLPDGALELAWLVGGVACINVVYGALSAMAQTDLKYVIAYSSVSHMGLVMLGAATLTEAGLNGSVFQMFAHGVMTGLFFALVGLVYEKAHSREIFKMGGFGRVMPGIATAFTVGGLSSLGPAGHVGFVAEILTFMGAWRSAHPWWLVPAIAGTFLTAVYVLRVTKQIFWGPPSPALPSPGGRPRARVGGARAAHRGDRAVRRCPGIALVPVDTATVPLLSRW
jgi:NADH-quinone oxidoreductase subunit M